MEQTVYIDLYFMINFSMDFLCFFLTAQLLCDKAHLLGAVVASALGGIYACAALLILPEGMLKIFLDVAVCVVMCLIAFGRENSVVAHIFVYIAVSAVLGGFMTALFSLFNRAHIMPDVLQEDGVSAWMLLFLALVSGAAALIGGRFFRKRTSRRYANVKIELFGKCVTLSGFCDSGNMLCDPISGKACVIADASALGKLLPTSFLSSTEHGSIRTEDIPELAPRIRLIPATGAVGKGILTAIRVDRVYIGEKDKWRNADVLIAIGTIGDAADGCQALIPASVMML